MPACGAPLQVGRSRSRHPVSPRPPGCHQEVPIFFTTSEEHPNPREHARRWVCTHQWVQGAGCSPHQDAVAVATGLLGSITWYPQARSCLRVLRPQAAWHTAAALAGWLGSLGHRQAAARASPTPRTGWHICARWGGCGAGGRRRRGALRQRGGRQGQHPSPCRARAAAGHGCCSVGTVQAGPRCQRASGCQQG